MVPAAVVAVMPAATVALAEGAAVNAAAAMIATAMKFLLLIMVSVPVVGHRARPVDQHIDKHRLNVN